MKNYTSTVNGNVYDVTVDEGGAGAAPVARPAAPVAPVAAPAAAPPIALIPAAESVVFVLLKPPLDRLSPFTILNFFVSIIHGFIWF